MSTTATLALKACPFCGDTDTKVFGESAPEWWVTCMGCRASSPCRTTRPQAIAGWNRRAALAQRTDPWRQAVDEALIAHALDCTGPGDDPKEKVKELIEWAVTIATDPRVAERAVTAAREQEASATGAEPVAWLAQNQDGSFDAYKDVHSLIDDCRQGFPVYATPTTSTTGKDLADGAVFHLASRIANLINRHDGKADTLMPELRSLVQVLATTGKVDASRVRDEALEEAAQLYGEGEVAAPGGHSQWGDAHQEGWIDGTKAYRDAIRSLIGTPKSAEGEGA